MLKSTRRLFARGRIPAVLCAVPLVLALALSGCDTDDEVGNNVNNGEDTSTSDAGVDTTQDVTEDTQNDVTEDTQDDVTEDTQDDVTEDTQEDTGDDGESNVCDPECTAPGENSIAECIDGTCEYRCEEGFVDADGDFIGADNPEDSDNGCELECEQTNNGDEICDGQDNDCNGIVDDGFSTGSCTVGEGACEASGEYVCSADGSATECDASEGTPSDETCNGIDDDCDGEVDEDATDAGTWYADSDGDGFGDPSDTVEACDQPSGYVDNADDCDDSDSSANTEVTVYQDSDGDGFTTGGAQTLCTDGSVPSGYSDTQNGNDCDDSDDTIYQEYSVYLDQDGDGFGAGNQTTVCGGASIPSGYSDQDGDCNDADAQVYPGQTELCDNIDNDCDGDIDEDFADKGTTCSVGEGVCERDGTFLCTSDGSGVTCNASPGSPTESPDETTCDGEDNDCDGSVDEGCDSDGDGWCDPSFTVENTTSECAGGTQTGDCDDNDNEVYPGAPGLCDGKDNDCNGDIDDIQRISGASQSFTPDSGSNASDSTLNTGPPPEVLSTPADDGYCVLAYDNASARYTFAHYKSDGTSVSETDTTLSTGNDRKIIDLAWDGTSCAGLYRLDNGFLNAIRWAPSQPSTIHRENIANPTDDTLIPFSSNEREAAIYPTCLGSGGSCTDSWVVGYIRENDGITGNYEIMARSLPADFTNSSNASAAETVDSNTSDLASVEVGPSPNANDKFAVVYKESFAWQVATAANTLDSVSDETDLNMDTNVDNYSMPVLARVNGTTYVIRRQGSFNLEIRETLSNYSYGATTTAGSQTGEDFVSKDILSTGPTADFWFLDSYGTDDTHSFTMSGGAFSQDQIFDADTSGSVDQQYLTLGNQASDPDILEVLTLTGATPFEVTIEQYTCY